MVRILLAIALSLVACKKDRDPDARVTVSSTRDAFEPIVDEDYRFRIEHPGAGWKLLDEDEVRHLVPDAVAGAMGPKGAVYGVVIVEAAPGVELESWSQLTIDSMTLEDREVSTSRAKVGEVEAFGFRMRGRVEGVPMVYAGRILLHQDHSYQILAWRAEGNRGARDADFDKFFDAFSLTEGEVRGRATAAGVESALGVGWRVKEGVFESAIAGLTAHPQDGWRLVVGAELTELNPEAEVALGHATPEVWVQLFAEPRLGMTREILEDHMLETLRAEFEVTIAEERLVLPFADGELAFRLLRATGPVPFEFLQAVHIEGEIALQVTAHYLAGQREKALEVLPAGLGSIGFLAPDARDELAKELEAEGDPQSGVGESWSIRRGTFRDFASGTSWRKPRGFWRLAAGQQARADNPDATFTLMAPAWGLHGVLVIEPPEDWTADDYHAAVVGSYEGKRSGPEVLEVRGAVGLLSEIESQEGDWTFTYRVLTVVDRARAVQFVVWGQSKAMKRHRAQVEEAFEALGFSSLTVVERDGGTYRDHRLGFSIDEPGAGWKLAEQTPANMAAIATLVSWTRSNNMIGVLSMCVKDEGRDERWFLDFFEQILRDLAPVRGRPSEREGLLGGRPARVLTWGSGQRPRLEAHLLIEGCTLHAVFAGGSDRGTLERTRKSFTLLD
jgi:hypothetical protein